MGYNSLARVSTTVCGPSDAPGCKMYHARMSHLYLWAALLIPQGLFFLLLEPSRQQCGSAYSHRLSQFFQERATARLQAIPPLGSESLHLECDTMLTQDLSLTLLYTYPIPPIELTILALNTFDPPAVRLLS